MNFQELVQLFWMWWVTENGRHTYSAELAEFRAFQLVFLVFTMAFMCAIVFNKKLRSKFF